MADSHGIEPEFPTCGNCDHEMRLHMIANNGWTQLCWCGCSVEIDWDLFDGPV